MSILETGAKYKKRIDGTHDNELMDTCYSAPFAHSSNAVLYCGGLKYGNEWPKFTRVKRKTRLCNFLKTFSRENIKADVAKTRKYKQTCFSRRLLSLVFVVVKLGQSFKYFHSQQ